MLPTGYKERKDIPLFDGTVGYFPLAFREMARVSADGNNQHNPGEPLHWARGKSMDQINTAFRHMVDNSVGNIYDGVSTVDNRPIYHLAKTFWRIGAALQLLVEKTEAQEAHRALAQAEEAVFKRQAVQDEDLDPTVCEWTRYKKADCLCNDCSSARHEARQQPQL